MPLIIAGREWLAAHLRRRKVLVVVDDTDDHAQLSYLLPPCALHAESLFLVTSRKKNLLDARCSSVSEVQLLSKGHDVGLFKAWAFAAGAPSWDTTELVPDMVACCGRLPLTLKVGFDSYSLYLDYLQLPWVVDCCSIARCNPYCKFETIALHMPSGPGRPSELPERPGA